MRQRGLLLLGLAGCAVLLIGGPLGAASERRPGAEAAARLLASKERLDWVVPPGTAEIDLRISDPVGRVQSFHFEAGQPPSLLLADLGEELAADGTYTWEIEWQAGTTDEEAPPVITSGYFSVDSGRIVPRNRVEHVRDPPPGELSPTIAADQVVSDDLIVDGKGCIGLGCTHGEGFFSEALRLKQAVVRLRLDDTSAPGEFPSNDWQIEANDAVSGGAGRLSVQDITGGTTPLTIRAGAPTNSLFIDPAGNVGLGTTTPGNKLHLQGSATSQILTTFGPNSITGPAAMFGYGGETFGRSSAFFNIRPDAGATAPNPSLRFLVSNLQRMIIDNEGHLGLGASINPSHPIHHQASGAHLSIGGGWEVGSSRALKQDIRELGREEAMVAFAALEPVQYRYAADPNDEHLGFIAEDVPALVASPDRRTLSPMDLLALLTRVVQEQQEVIDRLQTAIEGARVTAGGSASSCDYGRRR